MTICIFGHRISGMNREGKKKKFFFLFFNAKKVPINKGDNLRENYFLKENSSKELHFEILKKYLKKKLINLLKSNNHENVNIIILKLIK